MKWILLSFVDIQKLFLSDLEEHKTNLEKLNDFQEYGEGFFSDTLLNMAANEKKITQTQKNLDRFSAMTNKNLGTAEDALESHKEYMNALAAK